MIRIFTQINTDEIIWKRRNNNERRTKKRILILKANIFQNLFLMNCVWQCKFKLGAQKVYTKFKVFVKYFVKILRFIFNKIGYEYCSFQIDIYSTVLVIKKIKTMQKKSSNGMEEISIETRNWYARVWVCFCMCFQTVLNTWINVYI